MHTLTAAEANRQFSQVLREVAQGETVTVLSRGKPVATIVPAAAVDCRRRAAKAQLVGRLHGQPATGVREWRRDELYEDA